MCQVRVNGINNGMVTTNLCNTKEQMQKMTVLQLKQKVAEKVPGGAESERLTLIFNNKTLNPDSAPLSSFEIQHNSVIHLVRTVSGG
uniref:Ubiquitin-like domain-containing protein n=1 Tax=Myripristis murdjan TaxID=586833 RepID=A0A667Y819_9TELE